jgi:NAD(P) transhydrogenase subunit alpha
MELIMLLTVFVLACFVGYFVVWGVTPALHTPLMAVTNAISGIVVVAAIMVSGLPQGGLSAKIVGGVAIFLCSVNIFGGFAITRRMLAMFKSREAQKAQAKEQA